MRKPTRSRLQSQTGLEASFETGPATKSKPPSARSAAFPGSSFGLRLFRVLLPAFTFHGTHTFWFCSHSLLCPRHESSLDYSEGLTKLHTSLHSSISMLIFSFSIQTMPCVCRTKLQLHSATEMTVCPRKTTQVPSPHFSTFKVQVSNWILPMPV